MSEIVDRAVIALDRLDHRKAKNMDELSWMIVFTVIESMREPTDDICNLSTSSIYYSAEEIWKMMIDEVLK